MSIMGLYESVTSSDLACAAFFFSGENKMINKQQHRVLKTVVADINKVIDKVHSTRMDFAKGSVEQRLITDLDGARVTARAIIQQKEEQCKPNPSAD